MFLDQQIVEYLVAKRKLTGKQAGQLLAAAEGQSLELIMVERGMLDKHSLLQIKSLLTELRAVDLTAVPIDLQVVKLLPASMSRKFAAVVYGVEEERLLVASANPSDPFARYYISMRTNREIEILVAYIGDVQVLQDRAYPPEEPEVLGPSTYVSQPPLGKKGPGVIPETTANFGGKRVRLSQDAEGAYAIPEPTNPRSHSLVKPAAARPSATPSGMPTVSPQPADIVAIAETEIHEVRPITLSRGKSATLPPPPPGFEPDLGVGSGTVVAPPPSEPRSRREGRKSGDLEGRTRKDSGSLGGRPKKDSGSLGRGSRPGGRPSGGLEGNAPAPAPSFSGSVGEVSRSGRKSGSLEMPVRSSRPSGALEVPTRPAEEAPHPEPAPPAEEQRTGRKSGVLEMPTRPERSSGSLPGPASHDVAQEPRRPVRRSLELPAVTARTADTGAVLPPLAAPQTSQLLDAVAEPLPTPVDPVSTDTDELELELEVETGSTEGGPELPVAPGAESMVLPGPLQAPLTTRDAVAEEESEVLPEPLRAPLTTQAGLVETEAATEAEAEAEVLPAPLHAPLTTPALEAEQESEGLPEPLQAPLTTRALAVEAEPLLTDTESAAASSSDDGDAGLGAMHFNLQALPLVEAAAQERAPVEVASTVVDTDLAARVMPPPVVSRANERLEAVVGTGVNLLDSLAVMSTNLAESGRLGYVVPQILHTARVLTGADATAFLTCEPDRRYISYTSTDGGSADASRYAVPFDQSTVAGWCVVNTETVSIPSLRSDPRFSTTAEQAAGMPCGATACVPVRWGTEMLGALVAARHSDGAELDTRPLLMLVAPLGAAVWARQMETSIHDIRMETVQALLDWHEIASPGARQHGADVAQLATSMARTMALPPADIEELCLASLLHDIGLLPGRDETTHPQRSTQILQKISILQRMIPLVRSHHERFDGLGYPQGLKGDAIPLAARILAIAEVYCEQGLHKVERDDPSLNDFLKRFGSEFDPALLSAFIRSVNLD